jgi:lipoprotein-anchoring transpeptidase ErfK/SrfK
VQNARSSVVPGFRQAARFAMAAAAVTLAASISPAWTSSASSALPADVLSVTPSSGEPVGVAHPVTVTFGEQVANTAEAEQSIEFATSSPIEGTFTWLNDHVVQFNPDGFWPAHSTITVSAGDVKTAFDTGAQVVSVADLDAHTFTISIDGQEVRQMPASMGKNGFPTPIGTFSAMSKERNVVFDSRTIGIPLDDPEGYLIDGEYAIRVTSGGVYVHSAPWSVGAQGNSNVSHGCINLSPDNAAWYFDTVRVGDPIIVQA